MEWKAADIVELVKGKNFIVVGEGVFSDSKEPCIVFRAIDGSTPLQVLDKVQFEKVFKLVETH